MISFDTNILLYSLVPSSPYFKAANSLIESLSKRNDVILSEFVLFELYSALRNPAIIDKPLNSKEAHSLIAEYRNHPKWMLIGFPDNSKIIHDKIWEYVELNPKISRSRIFDLRLAFSLQSFGVKEFITLNQKDFLNLGFTTLRGLADP
jgi:predicted nucleic acid-binding protein